MDFSYSEEQKKIKAMEPEEKKEYFAESEKERAFDEEIATARGFDQGGRAGFGNGSEVTTEGASPFPYTRQTGDIPKYIKSIESILNQISAVQYKIKQT